MKILFTKFKHIGDVLLLTPTIKAVKQQYPAAEIWVWVRAGTEGVLSGCDGISRLLISAPSGSRTNSRGVQLLQDIRNIMLVRRQKFDLAFDFSDGQRGMWMTCASGAKFIAVSSTDDIPEIWSHIFDVCLPLRECGSHRVIKDYALVRDVMSLSGSVPPLQFIPEKADDTWAKEHALENCTVIHPSTRWKRKSWPLEHWINLCGQLEQDGHRLVLSSGPSRDEVEFCEQIKSGAALQAVLTRGTLTWAGMAGILMRSRLFVGVDTAAMHLAAACQTKVVALFGPSLEISWHPWMCDYRIVAPNLELSILKNPLVASDPRLRRMEDIEVKDVLHACADILR